MEDLTYQIQLLQNQLKAQTPAASTSTSSTTNSNLSAATPTAATPTAAATAATTPAISPEQTAFNQAYSLLTQKKYTQATTAFNNFLIKYPKSTQASTAHYWLGDLYLAQGMPEDAAKQYKVTASTVNAPKRPNAMIQLGAILTAYGDNARAKQIYQAVIKNYPKSTYAASAQKALTSMS
jgi:tol-pal system protein YbgF